jgi:ferredoxin
MVNMRISVKHDRCCGAGLCADSLPTVFDQDDDGVVVLLTETPDESTWKAVEEAEFTCPSGAIMIHRSEDSAA